MNATLRTKHKIPAAFTKIVMSQQAQSAKTAKSGAQASEGNKQAAPHDMSTPSAVPEPKSTGDFQFEVATPHTGTSCTHCHQDIAPGELRIRRTRSPNESLHFGCIFLEPEEYPLFTHQVKGVEGLSRDDRELVIRKLASLAPSMKPAPAGAAAATAGVVVEYARSMEAECQHCAEPISAPGEIRVGLLKWRPKTHVFVPHWHHLFCLFRRPDFRDMGLEDVRQFAGYKRLEPHGQELVMRLLEAHKRGFLKIPKSKRKHEELEEDTEEELKETSESVEQQPRRRLPGEHKAKRRRII